MRLKFYWLPRRIKESQRMLSGEEFLKSPETPSESSIGPGFLQFFNVRTCESIQSGDTITLYTPDPVALPLPSEHLINLQWHLHRIAALSASAVDAYMMQFGDEDDSDGDDDYGSLPVSSEAAMNTFSSQIHPTSSTSRDSSLDNNDTKVPDEEEEFTVTEASVTAESAEPETADN